MLEELGVGALQIRFKLMSDPFGCRKPNRKIGAIEKPSPIGLELNEALVFDESGVTSSHFGQGIRVAFLVADDVRHGRDAHGNGMEVVGNPAAQWNLLIGNHESGRDFRIQPASVER